MGDSKQLVELSEDQMLEVEGGRRRGGGNSFHIGEINADIVIIIVVQGNLNLNWGGGRRR